ncbi:similar to Saccharomyces cerevisiae YNL237W YTP1 Probable type-III integral membrane protein of unknown function [Geotrichum candidum]|uniref:Cytochrome b561 domain-containing protein n=2 Tax=Geotrichum candidum TaxID=1173061 RepID=A0A0J9X321_GEOCN|nr:similar to Saccharomyces cerevisiae YNL237W YTP1 Probable type-III integral membrane protein of unknown function [Geotrichum candidum]
MTSHSYAMLFGRHEHSANLEEGTYVSPDPIDGVLWAHILIMMFTFGILFPVGLVLGLSRNRWHVPVQTLAGLLAITGYFIGHHHKGREFPSDNIHSKFGGWVMLMALSQIIIGVLLKLHINKGFLGKVRQVMVKIHYIIAVLIPIVSWVQIGFGVITLEGFCHADHLGQCLAHGIMGSSFIAYGFVLAIMLYFGEKALASRNKSQEFYDSCIITAWGIVNTFTEHRWGQSWSHGDYQHTSMGIIWWCAGMVGILLSKNWSTGEPKRNHIPALVLIFTGWAMSEHAQHLMISTKVHAFFGLALMAAGFTRIIEISFVLKDANSDSRAIKAFQHLPPLLLVESGICFIGANEEQLQLLSAVGIDHSSYLLVLSSCAFLLYLLILGLITLYKYLQDTNEENQWKHGHVAIPSSDDQQIELNNMYQAPPQQSGVRRDSIDIVLDDDYEADAESLRHIPLR